jgi:predicted phosphodiesterase
MRLAAIADVHGNRFALEAVLADIAANSIREVVNLGDLLAVHSKQHAPRTSLWNGAFPRCEATKIGG